MKLILSSQMPSEMLAGSLVGEKFVSILFQDTTRRLQKNVVLRSIIDANRREDQSQTQLNVKTNLERKSTCIVYEDQSKQPIFATFY